ncbi:MAG: hypothetical protein QM820_24395 [Minicystis sp.]
MKRLLLLSALAILAGCRETPPSGGNTGTGTPAPRPETTAATPTATATATATSSAAPGATGTASAAATAAAAGPTRTWSFDKDKADGAPAGFDLVSTGGKAGKWLVKAESVAPTAPNVLAQLDTDKAEGRVTAAIAGDSAAKDARVAVRCKLVSGKVDQSCGVVVRYKDEKNYYLARVNGLEKDVNLYVVKDGKRTSLGGWKGATIGEAWHEIRVDAKGDHLELYWDGTRVFEANDKSFPDAGRAGVWVRADSVTYFDELAVTPLG